MLDWSGGHRSRSAHERRRRRIFDAPRHWVGAKRDMIWAKFAKIAAAITRHEEVRINAPGGDHAAIADACNRAKAVPKRVRLFDHPHNDVCAATTESR